MATITRHAITWTFSGTPTSGTFVTGDPYFVAGTGGTITAISPAPTGTGTTARNGSMVNPTSSLLHGWDGRVHQGQPFNTAISGAVFSSDHQYADARNAGLSLPLTLTAGQSLCSSVSSAPGTPGTGDEYIVGFNNPNALSDMSVLTCLASNPGDGLAFRPPYAGSTKPLWLESQVDWGKLPLLSPPIADPTTGGDPFFANDLTSLARLQYDLPAFYKYLSVTTFRPINNLEWYPANQAQTYNTAIMYAMCDFSGSERTYARRLIQLGIDLYAVLQNSPDVWVGGAGFSVGRMFPIMFAGYMLDDSDMLNVCSTSTGVTDVVFLNECAAFHEISGCFYSPNAYSGYRLPRPRSSYPNGPPLFGDVSVTSAPSPGYGGNHSFKDPAGKYDAYPDNDAYNNNPYPATDGGNTIMANAGTYRDIAAPNFMAPCLAIRLLGIEDYLGTYREVFLDWCDRWHNDPGLWCSALTTYFDDRWDYDGPIAPYNTSDMIFRQDKYGYGGTGNGFIQSMWNTYRYPNNSRKIFVF
jgi:hypothetical protein